MFHALLFENMLHSSRWYWDTLFKTISVMYQYSTGKVCLQESTDIKVFSSETKSTNWKLQDFWELSDCNSTLLITSTATYDSTTAKEGKEIKILQKMFCFESGPLNSQSSHNFVQSLETSLVWILICSNYSSCWCLPTNKESLSLNHPSQSRTVCVFVCVSLSLI